MQAVRQLKIDFHNQIEKYLHVVPILFFKMVQRAVKL